jgi:hypothetical protein
LPPFYELQNVNSYHLCITFSLCHRYLLLEELYRDARRKKGYSTSA